LGLQLAAYCISLRNSWTDLLSTSGGGIIGRHVGETFTRLQSPWIPQMSWLVAAGERVGIGELACLTAAWALLLIAALLLIIGLLSRTAAIVCWFVHLCAAKSGGLVAYGVDNLMTCGLFYLMLSPLPDRWAFDYRLRQKRSRYAELLSLFRRLLQIHLCVIYFFGGLTKALGGGWWNGDNLWRALTRPPFDVIAPEVVVRFSWLLPALGIAIWLIEIAYPVFIWPQRTRLLWLTLICMMHFGIGLGMGMHLFAVVMIVLNVAAFGPAQTNEQSGAASTRAA
jgi:hypothetical protein